MLLSRAALVGRIAATVIRNKLSPAQTQQFVRNSHVWNYRNKTTHSKGTIIAANCVGAYMWWWILWHLWHEHAHITGEFEYPDPSAWTNAELGIPADDVEE